MPKSLMFAESAHMMTWLLMIFYALNYVDRQIVSILAGPIGTEFALSDTQIGIMTGLAFAFFYAGLGIPLARWTDKPTTDRPRLMAACLVIWSGMTALCGLAQSFVQMVLCRIGVAIGEAGCLPVAHSLIAEVVPKERRSSAIAFFGLGQPIGALLGIVVGGLLAERYGWRMAFMCVGIPGIVLAIIGAIVLPEPRRRATPVEQKVGERASVLDTLGQIVRSRAYMCMLGAGSVMAFVTFGQGVWIAIFFMRSHGLSTGQTGLWLGLLSGGMGIVGMLLGGFLADRFGARRASGSLIPVVFSLLLALPLQIAAAQVGDWRVAMVLFGIVAGCHAFYFGPGWGLVQGLVQPSARATAAAVKLFVQAILGLGVGPLLFGLISDALRPTFGDDSVRMVLIVASFLLLVPAFFYWRASRYLEVELDRAVDPRVGVTAIN